MMGKFSVDREDVIKLVLVALVLGWLWGARAQAIDRHCFAIKATEREAFGFTDWITTGWDWPIHWLKGTPADPIPCKPGVQGVTSRGFSGADMPKEGTMVGDVMRGNDGQIAPGGLTGSLPGSDPSASATGHRNLDRYLVEHSGNPSSTQGTPSPADNAGADQGLTPEARALLERRLKEEQ
ncbi:hypothetical protein DAH74_09575 [Sphingomonas koreensis]|nr:hypothetical protein [Sphingomonas sp. ABOLD]RSU21546.1 hypothetical protein CA224_08760 [Sphingomonas koreensis]RSU28250.1 hypothetical protein BRX39_21480 [Sphingomonas koreensis]RSU29270.1 hypothetical protein CA225_07515 [Sphingomonas koreensis]RSU48805.1 hypothetical protein CA221_15225 [Sphingomonas koreensis]RSU89049.1 hypothetical protein CA253_08775 [Sphingomonas koreensis]